MTEIAIHTEQIDDIPLLFSFFQQMGIQETLDTYAEPHGNPRVRGDLGIEHRLVDHCLVELHSL